MSIQKKILDKMYDKVIFNPYFKRIAISLLNSHFLFRNPIYTYCYKKRMKFVMKQYENLPFRVMIENTNICNANCIFCPHSKMKRDQGYMSLNLYRKIIDECVKFKIEYVIVYGFGEPLIDPHFPDRIAYAKSKGIQRVATNTNASLLNEEISKQIINAGLDEICISLDAASKDIYSKIRRGLDFDVVEENIRTLIQLRKSIGFSHPKIILSFVQTEENISQIKKYISKWKDKVEAISIDNMHNWHNTLDKIKVTDFHHSRKRDPCRFVWTDMVISWDGRVPLCCLDYDNEVIIGDANKVSIREIWSGGILRKIRLAHQKNLFHEITICSNCQYKSVWWISK